MEEKRQREVEKTATVRKCLRFCHHIVIVAIKINGKNEARSCGCEPLCRESLKDSLYGVTVIVKNKMEREREEPAQRTKHRFSAACQEQ